MKLNKYQEDFDKVEFSKDFEERVIKQMENNKVQKPSSKNRKLLWIVPAVSAAFVFSILIVNGVINSNSILSKRDV